MQEHGKHSQTAILASDLRALFGVMKTRRTKLLAYGFAFAFVACTAFLAFNPSGNAASPWFNNLFTSASSAASAAPYRSHINSIFSYIFPNSSSPSPERLGSRNSTGTGVGSVGNGAPVAGQSGKGVGPQNDGKLKTGLLGNGASGKNQTEKVMGSPENGVLGKKDGVLGAKNQTGGAVGSQNDGKLKTGLLGNGVSGKNQTEKLMGSVKNGVLGKKDGDLVAKNQTGSAVGLSGNGVPGRNQTAKGISSGGSGVSAKKPAKERVGFKEDGVLGGKNQTKSGVGLQGSPVPKRNQSGNGVITSGENGASAANSRTGAGIASKGNGVSTNNQMENGENGVSAVKNQTGRGVAPKGNGVSTNSQKKSRANPQENDVLAKNQSAKGVVADPKTSKTSAKAEHKAAVAEAKIPKLTSSLTKGNGTEASASTSGGGKRQAWIKAMKGCDIFQGRWVKDDSYPLYPEGSCPHIDEPFDCYLNGRPDRAYQKLRWQPNGCNIPRLNATDMLDVLRGKRLVFVGDSLNRNMWESLVCVLRHSVKDKSKVFEASGRHEFRTEGSYSFLFTDYNCSVEFFRSPFLVREWEMPASSGKTKETLRLDLIERSSSKYKDADVIVFNTGHWWTHEKTSKGKDYYQEGDRVYGELNVIKAFHKALNTWAKWVDANVNPKKSLVFFRGYSASHFRGGQWNSGGQCHKETEPIKNDKYLSSYPPKMSVLEMVIKGMKTPVSYLNITRMTDYRKDAHPSIYRKQNMTEEERRSSERYQDCSHWCLPGVPDSWNELLYAQILIKQHQLLQ